MVTRVPTYFSKRHRYAPKGSDFENVLVEKLKTPFLGTIEDQYIPTFRPLSLLVWSHWVPTYL